MSRATQRRELLMPRVAPSMADGRIERWHVAEGQSVAEGDVLAEIATQTATMEIEAETKGRVERILVPAGTTGVKVNTPIAILLDEASHGPARGPSSTPVPLMMSSQAASDHDPEPDLPTYREAVRDALAEEMRRDSSVFLVGVDVVQNRGAPKATQGLVDEFGDGRVVSAPPLDDAVAGLAIGAALAGLKPIVSLASWGKAIGALEAPLTAAAATRYVSGGVASVPIVFRGPNGRETGVAGPQSRCIASLLAQIPGLTVLTPATPATAKALLKAAIRSPDPVAVLEHELLYATRGPLPADEMEIAVIGKARVARPGTDVTIATFGHAVLIALEAADQLALDGIDAEVVDLMSVRPLDVDTVAASAQKTHHLITLEEGWPGCGIGAEIIAAVSATAFDSLRSAPMRATGADVPMPYAEALQALAIPTPARVAALVRAALGRA